MIPEPLPIDIIEFVTGEDYLGIGFLSPHQLSILKAIYGLPMLREERLAFLELSEGREPDPRGYQDVVMVCGVRSGKSYMSAAVATFESVRWGPALEELMPAGSRAKTIIIAQNEKGANEVRDYIEGMLTTLEGKGHSVLKETTGQEKAIIGKAIKLCWPVDIVVYPARKASVRGVTGLCFIGDEIAHWECAEGAYNQDEKIMKAVRTRFATLRMLKPRRLLISSPDAEEGVLWKEWQKRDTGRSLVVKAPSWLLYPGLNEPDENGKKMLDDEQERDPESFMTEYGAEFAVAGGGLAFLTPEIIDRAVVKGIREVPPKSGMDYAARVDAAFKHDRFSFGVAHTERLLDDTSVHMDFSKSWTPPPVRGKKKPRPLDFEKIIEEISLVLRAYGLDRVEGDQFADVPIRNEFAKHGIVYIEVPTTQPGKYDDYKNLRGGLRAGLVRLLEDPEMVKDLKGLIRKETNLGRAQVMAPKRSGCYDDAATVAAGLVGKLLPMGGGLDIAALNRDAMPERTRRGLDWDPRKYGDSLPYSEGDLDSAFVSVDEMVM